MKKYIKEIINNPLFAGSAIMIIGSSAINSINYIYHLIMGRLLGPAGYGELVALLSLTLLLGIIPTSLSLTIIKYISAAKEKKEVEGLISWLSRKSFILALIIFLFVAISSSYIASFLKIDQSWLVVLTGAMLLFNIPTVFLRSVLQGLLRFKQTVVSILVDTGSKLILGIAFILIGFSVGGAILAMVIAAFLGWILAKKFIDDYSGKNLKEINVKPLLLYSIPVFIQSISITSLYSMDLVLVKHFFSNFDAGIYAALSTLGKIIYFGAGPISNVMFPVISKRNSSGKKYFKVFIFSFIITLFISITILFIYLIFPELAIKILYGNSYLLATPLLVYFGLFITLFTLSTLLINFHLSLGQTKVVIFPLLAAIGQVIGIWFYHSSLQMVVTVSIAVNALLLLALFVYFGYASKISFNNSTRLQTRKNNS